MDILETLLNAQGGSGTRQLARQFGLRDDQVSSALSALVPALSAGVARNLKSPDGLEGLVSALSGTRHDAYLDDLSTLGRPETVADGNGILGHIFGSKDVSRSVAHRASAATGLGEGVLKQMLPVVAAMMMGAMSKQVGHPAPGQTASAGDGLLGMLTPMLDSNRDGSVVDDVVGMLGKFMRR